LAVQVGLHVPPEQMPVTQSVAEPQPLPTGVPQVPPELQRFDWHCVALVQGEPFKRPQRPLAATQMSLRQTAAEPQGWPLGSPHSPSV
jgi:hypothetical protein